MENMDSTRDTAPNY
ncbi:rCG38942 [Rattus norvegicus]|uniref:RCG38942 n=1 Tax=Rattus norvegicus TaxID=10116 RepID=A6KLC4_RAT|nr:rCG38942 [Rattus norvegicus]